LKNFTSSDSSPTENGVNFFYLYNVTNINISKNLLKSIEDIKIFDTLINLNISYNHITDISVLKNNKSLEVLKANNNIITNISDLAENNNLTTLDVSENKVNYPKITMNTLKSLRNLTNLGIKGNPVI